MSDCKHEFRRTDTGDPEADRDECHLCGLSWLEWARGFSSNVIPKKLRKLNG